MITNAPSLCSSFVGDVGEVTVHLLLIVGAILSQSNDQNVSLANCRCVCHQAVAPAACLDASVAKRWPIAWTFTQISSLKPNRLKDYTGKCSTAELYRQSEEKYKKTVKAGGPRWHTSLKEAKHIGERAKVYFLGVSEIWPMTEKGVGVEANTDSLSAVRVPGFLSNTEA